jgi:tetratricopeptide (TPR) repeat protein
LHRGQAATILAISGMGGIGKTELAWQYADRQEKAEKYPGGICWLRAREGVGTQIIDFARSYLDLKPPTEGELEARVRWCWERWRVSEALIVFDDVQTFDDIRAFLPPRESRFKVLMTSRSRFGSPVQNYDIKVLSEAASLDLLRAIVKDDGIDQELETATQLCEWLGYLPLALELVGRYWARNRNWSLAKVFAKLKEKELNARAFVRSQEMTATHEGLVAAFDLSWEALEGLPQGAGRFAQRLGAYLSVLALAPIPWEMVEAALSEWDEEELQDARSLLVNFSLLTEVEREWYELHPLIRLFFASKLGQVEGAEAWKRAVCQVTARVCRQIEQTVTREQVQVLTPVIPHLEVVAQQLAQDYCEDEDLAWAFVGVARFYNGQGLYQQAESWFEHCLRVTHDRFGEAHPDVAASLSDLAGLYRAQGRYSEAELLYQQALALRQVLLGENHPNVDQPSPVLFTPSIAPSPLIISLPKQTMTIYEGI